MKVRPDRNIVKISVSDYERMRNEIYEEALIDGVKQGAALCLIVLEKNSGWKKKRLERVFDGVGDLLRLPDIFGAELTTEDAIQHLRKEFEIDIDRLEMKTKNMSDNLLKPCPFCGRAPGLYLERHNMWTVRCHKCGVTMCCATSEIAINTWNKREVVESNDRN